MKKRVPAYEGREKYIFVSYRHSDSDNVLPVIGRLYAEKYRLWYDEGIVPGSEWPHNIEVHLKACDTVLVFVSASSLESVNCENEVVNALRFKKRIIQYSVDGTVHPLIKEKPVYDAEELVKTLDDELIGEWSEYDLQNRRSRSFSIWNVLLVFSLLLSGILLAAIYGLQAGYFDRYLNSEAESEESIEVRPQENLEITDDTFAQAILEQLGQEELLKELELEETDRKALNKALGLEEDARLTYYDLTVNKSEKAELENCTQDCLYVLKYLGELQELRLRSVSLSSLEALRECPKLKSVYLSAECFPLLIPEVRQFSVYYYK